MKYLQTIFGFTMLCVAFACIGAGVLFFKARVVAEDLGRDAGQTLQSVQKLATNTDLELNGKVLPSAKKLIDDGRRDAVLLNKQEKAYYALLNKETPALLVRVNAAVQHLGDAAEDLGTAERHITADVHTSFQKLDASLDSVPPVMRATQKTVEDLDSLVNDPRIRETVAHVETATGNVADTTGHVEAMTADLQGKLHNSLHPTRRQAFMGSLLTAAKLLVSARPW